jgi:DNA-binding MarR family transcriptional regulator
MSGDEGRDFDGKMIPQKRDEEDRAAKSNSDEKLRSLNDQLNDPSLKSSVRIMILISLTINGKMSFVELLALTNLGKGSLENHLVKLEASGLVQTKNVKTFGGMRQVVQITGRGSEACRLLLQKLQELGEKVPTS